MDPTWPRQNSLVVAALSLLTWRASEFLDGGTPYHEPAFASIRPIDIGEEKARDVEGVAYLITPRQYDAVIGLEGGGMAYADIELDAEPVSGEDDVVRSGKKVEGSNIGDCPRNAEESTCSTEPKIYGECNASTVDEMVEIFFWGVD